MKDERPTPKTVDDYIARYPKGVRQRLEAIRATVRKSAPGAEETISYGMPTFVLKGNLIHFAVYKNHIGLYPAPTGSASFNKKLHPYRAARSTVRFPLDRPIPLDLLGEIVKWRVRENAARTQKK
jgi:uncharacterized protein YdhG (YjbR/CyaY superfamily)